MLKWFSGEEGEPGSGGSGSPPSHAGGGEIPVEEMAERLTQTEQLVTQLKEMIREKDAALCSKDDQLKAEKEACEAKLSKLRLQNKAKVTSLTAQLEELKKQQGPSTPTHGKKGSSEGGEQASRGKIVLLKKKVDELEQQLGQRDVELETKMKELESQRQRGEEMDAMLTEKDKKLAEKEAYIVHLQTALAGDQPITPAPPQKAEDGGAMQELQLLVQSLTKKVGEAEERYSLLQEQTDSLKDLLATEKEQYSQKESMYKQNIQTFKDIIIQKDSQLMEINQMHEQELFKLAAKSDASADLEQLLKALKQKLHEKEEVLLGKTQVIDVLQGEVDGRDQQIKELSERLQRLQVERESLESKMEAEKHVMRAQLRDLMEKQQAEVQRMTEQHQAQLDQTQQDLMRQLEDLRRAQAAAPPASQEASGSGNVLTDSASIQRIAELEAQAKQKTDEASRSEAKFLKMKAWSKSRIRQLEEELKRSQAGVAPPDLTALRSRITALEEEREENLWKVEQYEEVKAKNEMLEAKLVVYEEQQRTLQADLEQFTKRAASQASESGSADDTQSQVLEWQEMVAEVVSARDRAREEKAALSLRISHMEEEREALVTRQQELEEELAQARGLDQHRAKKLALPSQRSLQEDFELHGQAPFQDPRSISESTTPMEGENMGGWWPEYSTPDTDGLRSVVEELELERNQLQEQILSLEERCQDLEDRLQLQARIEALQNESDKLQSQLASVRSQQSREAEKHQLLVNSLNEQLKGLTDTQECLQSSLIEKENTLAKTSEKLELISSLRQSLSEKDIQCKELSDKLLQTEHTFENISMKYATSEKQCSELKAEVMDLTQKLSVLKEKTQKQDVTIETLQTDLDQTNEELDKLNTSHLEERAQLIYDLQSCEREIDNLKDALLEKDKEISTLVGNMAEYAEQVTALKQEIKLKEESLVQVENALSKAEREANIMKESQSSDQQALNNKITELVEKLKEAEMEMVKAGDERESKGVEVEHLIKQAEKDKTTIQDLRGEIQKQNVSHHNHLSECETHITSLKEQLAISAQKLQESEGLVLQLKDRNASNEKLQQELNDKEQTYEKELKSFKEEQNKLLAQVEKYNNDFQTLSKQLDEQVLSEENVKQVMQEKMEKMASLENQLKDERQKFNTENERLCNELQSRSENISKLENLLKSMTTEKEQLQENLKGLNEELELERRNLKELNEKVTSALEFNSSLENQVQVLTKERDGLELEVTEHVKNISQATAEMDSLHVKISELEMQHSQSNTIIQGLQKDKEELTTRTLELNRVLEQSTHSTSEIMLAKTNECSSLQQLLREREETVTQQQEEVQSLTSKIDKMQRDLAEKEQTVTELQARIEAQQNEQAQLMETLSLLQEQQSSLKSGLLEKDAMYKQKQEEFQSLQKETENQKNIASRLQAEAESLIEERSQLREQLGERDEMLKKSTQECQKHKDELNNKNTTIRSLSDRVSVMEENARKLECEADQSKTELASLKSHTQALSEENRQLRAACESKEKELAQRRQLLSDLDGQLKATLDQNSSFSMKISSLTENNQRLQEELAQNMKSVSELTAERLVLQEKTSDLEIQISDSQKTVASLLKEKEELAAATDELKKVLKESKQAISVGLLEKTNECANLLKNLREKEQQLQSLQEQIDSLKMQVDQLSMSLVEKDQTVSEQTSQIMAQQDQLLQLQDTVSMLQEQGSVLKSGLMEKDVMLQQKVEECSVSLNEVKLQKELSSQMQVEVELLRKECVEAKQQLQQKEQTLKEATHEFQNHKDELNKRNESVISLSAQLGAMNESASEMEVEITNLKASVQKLTAENCQLIQDEGQRKAEVTDFHDNIQALSEQNVRLKSELQKAVAELAKANEEAANLNLEIQGINDTLKQQENSIQQLNSEIAARGELLKEKEGTILELEDSVCTLRGQVDSLTSESSILKNILEKKEESSLEYQSTSSAAFDSLTSHLQAKEAECESLKEKISHLEESVSKLNSNLEVQTSEVTNLKMALEEKEAALLEQAKALQDFQKRGDEALLFKTQFMESTELASQLQSQMQLLSTESEKCRKTAEETQSAFNNLQEKYAATLEELQDSRKQLSQRTDEVSELRMSLHDSNNEYQTAKTTVETLKSNLHVIQEKLGKAEDLNSSLSKEKDDAFASHQASVSLLTVEIERLKSQHLQVVAQMNALTENLEQREMALHAINSQYSAQAKHASQLVSEMQKLEEQNKSLNEEIGLSKEENQKLHIALSNENTHLKEEFRKLFAEKEELERRRQQTLAELQVQMEQKSSSVNELVERMTSEKQSLQAKGIHQKMDELQQTAHKEVRSQQEATVDQRSDAEPKDLPVKESGLEEVVSRLDAERRQLHRDLQRCMYEIQQRDQYFQQLNTKLQEAVEEKAAVTAQLRAVSQTLRDTQNRCHWLESQGRVQGLLHTEVAPGAPQEKSNDSMLSESAEASQLRERLLEVELSLADERARRETTEEALRLAEDRVKSAASSLSRDSHRDFSIEMEAEEEWEALTLNPNQPLITRKVKGGMVACRRWLRGRSLYFSRLLTSRTRSRYFFLAYLFTVHVLVLMCLTGTL
ncbi:golgin subfamily B member 1 isoform X2 [Pundamilia nyererei]|uniref:Golgin subfamily B member 1 isoform X2 n=1 Tax=Pundamilia nyererei TaxID=303518 RepID=A0A9Y6JHP4_9CICH|nr:PREDICTED: golgin subfamily B member 1-like isoform X2 [Pundamilia nyererei]